MLWRFKLVIVMNVVAHQIGLSYEPHDRNNRTTIATEPQLKMYPRGGIYPGGSVLFLKVWEIPGAISLSPLGTEANLSILRN